MLLRKPYIDCRQHSKYIGLNKSYQAFEYVEEDSEQHRDHAHGAQNHRTVFRHYENYADYAQNLYMTCQHIGKQPYSKRNRLHECAENLDNGHYGFEESRHRRIEQFPVIVAGSENIDRKESKQGEHKGHGDIAGKICPSRKDWKYSEQVVEKYEQESHAEIW